MGDPFRSDLPLLEYVLRGVRMDQARNREGPPPMERLPITPDILLKVRVILERNRMSFDNIMLWAAYCTAFFGFLRSAELTVPSQAAFDPGYHLSFGDILFDTPKNPSTVSVRIKASKTDPLRKGVTLLLGRIRIQSYVRWRHLRHFRRSGERGPVPTLCSEMAPCCLGSAWWPNYERT